jgi:hypothetical protein
VTWEQNQCFVSREYDEDAHHTCKKVESQDPKANPARAKGQPVRSVVDLFSECFQINESKVDTASPKSIVKPSSESLS